MKTKIAILSIVFVALIAIVFDSGRKKKSETEKAISEINKALEKQPYESNISARSLNLDTAILYEAAREINLYKSFFKNTPIGLLQKEKFDDCDCFRITDWNPAWERIVLNPVGIDSADYMLSNDFDYWPDSLSQLYEYQDNYVLDSNRVIEFESPIEINGQVKNARWVKYSDGKKRLFLIYLSTKTIEEL